MINSVIEEFQKLREKDIQTKRNIKEMIDSLKTELITLDQNLEKSKVQMSV
jgi:hypothetical protein